MCYLILIFFFALGYLLYARFGLKTWIAVAFTYLLLLSHYSHHHTLALLGIWALVLTPFAVIMVPALRKRLLTSWAFDFAKKKLPSITPSEREALSAGTVTWDAELFSGMPNWKKLFAYKPAQLSEEEQEFLEGPVGQIAQNKHHSWDMWHKDFTYRKDLVKLAKDHGLFGLITPKKYGGKEFSVTAVWQIQMKLQNRLGPVGQWVLISNTIGAGELIDRYGTQEQKGHYLPRLVVGEEMPCFALTSAVAGSDATAIEDYGIVCKGKVKGKNVLGIKLNFSKRYITLGCDATLMSLAFKLYDPDQLLGQKENIGVTVALVPTNLKGVTQGRRHYPIGAAFPNGPLQGKDVFIPLENIIGGREGAGKAWTMLTQALATGRATSIPTGAVWTCKHSFYMTSVYCGIRKQFGLPIGHFESVQEKLAQLAGFTYITDAMRLLTFSQIQAGERPAIPAAISKYNSTELARQCAIHAIDLQGGKGVMNGPNNMIADVYATVPVGVTVEGSNTLTRGLIVFGQGSVRCHPYILSEMSALESNDPEAFEGLLMKHINFTLSNHLRSLFLGVTNGRLSCPTCPHKKMKRGLQQLNRLSASFAFLSDMVMIIFGGKLKRMEALSGRFADAFSMLYMGCAAIKHYHDKGYPEPLRPVVEWSLQWSLNLAEQNLAEIIDNLPNPLLRGWLRLFVFPLGRRIKKPSDPLTLQVGSLVQSSKAIREELADGMFLTPTDNNPITLMEEALAQTIKISDLNKRIRDAAHERKIQGYTYLQQVAQATKAKVITKEEEKILLGAHEIIMKVINVDDFSLEELQAQK